MSSPLKFARTGNTREQDAFACCIHGCEALGMEEAVAVVMPFHPYSSPLFRRPRGWFCPIHARQVCGEEGSFEVFPLLTGKPRSLDTGDRFALKPAPPLPPEPDPEESPVREWGFCQSCGYTVATCQCKEGPY